MAFYSDFKTIFKKIMLYLLITLVPSLIFGYFIAQHHSKDIENKDKIKAQQHANSHAMNIENFLGETIGRLEMLASSIKIQNSNLLNIEAVLKETQLKDSRFSGFYFANPSGNLLISTNQTTSLVNVGDRPYFQEALESKQTSISEAHIGRVTGRYIITIATPIVVENEVQNILLASLRIDKIEEALLGLIHDELLMITDSKKQTIIKAGSIDDKINTVTASLQIPQVPWTISASILSEDKTNIQKLFLQNLILLLTITNILYILVKYLLLRKKVEREKKQTELQKLELIGNLAASTAHEIRNPLTGIKGLVTLLSEEHLDNNSQYYFGVIQKEIDRINAIVSELLVLGKPTSYILNAYDAKIILKEIEPIILSEANFMNVDLNIQYPNDHLPIACVKDHLKQVVLNLAKNSLQAMPKGGKLSIILQKDANSCVIRVEDTGIGMQKEQLTKVFDPFYSMKKDGSGLGLTVCKRIIETFGGQITIDSTPNAGTQVEITLPLNDK